MIERYARSPMKDLWTEQAGYERWLEVELAATEVMEALGEIPEGSADTMRSRAALDLDRIREFESEIGHDLLAFIRAVEETIGETGRYLHRGLTASDVKDTALAMTVRDAVTLVLDDLDRLQTVLKRRAEEHKTTLMVGRTHGMHAEPITFGLKLLNWYDELDRDRHRLKAARQVIAYGKISGAVGTYAHVNPEVEHRVCERLGLKPARVSNQILQRDRHAQVLSTLAILGAGLERIAIEIRHLQRTEVGEVREKASHGSSSMPHKQNPIASETISGLARVLRGNLGASLESIALWHERDISHSSVERIVLPDSFIAVDYMLGRMTEVIEKLEVDAGRMRENLERTQGLIFSQVVLLKLVDRGMTRQVAHELIRALAEDVQTSDVAFKTLLQRDERILTYLSVEEIDGVFNE
ncbi:MAG: adenylosuccinate lyase, partial [Candidatus Bipolaricaulia bacterium]